MWVLDLCAISLALYIFLKKTQEETEKNAVLFNPHSLATFIFSLLCLAPSLRYLAPVILELCECWMALKVVPRSKGKSRPRKFSSARVFCGGGLRGNQADTVEKCMSHQQDACKPIRTRAGQGFLAWMQPYLVWHTQGAQCFLNGEAESPNAGLWKQTAEPLAECLSQWLMLSLGRICFESSWFKCYNYQLGEGYKQKTIHIRLVLSLYLCSSSSSSLSLLSSSRIPLLEGYSCLFGSAVIYPPYLPFLSLFSPPLSSSSPQSVSASLSHRPSLPFPSLPSFPFLALEIKPRVLRIYNSISFLFLETWVTRTFF